MKKNVLLALCIIASYVASVAQPVIYNKSISKTGINVRGGAVVLEQQSIYVPTAGKVIVHFDGQAYASVGDRIVLAASNTPTWGVNDGNVTVEAFNSDVNVKPFSHTRVYNVSAGINTFYAVAQNYVEEAGTGVASIYGTLTVEYYASSATSFVLSQGISKTNIDVRSSVVTLAQQLIYAPSAGKVIVHFDGLAISSVGDRIVLAASNTPNWGVNDGNVGVKAQSADVNQNSFSHTRVYSINAGFQYLYAVAQNYVNTSGTGIASIYGNFTVEFIPNSSANIVAIAPISQTNINVRGGAVAVGQKTIYNAVAGKVIVHFDGQVISTPGDRIVLAASNTPNWGVNDGNVGVEAAASDRNSNSFSHTRVYSVGAGFNTFYAVAQNYVETTGTGVASFYGELTLTFVPYALGAAPEETAALTTEEAVENSDLSVYPNPAADVLNITYLAKTEGYFTVNILDQTGRTVKTIINEAGVEKTTAVDISSLAQGIYFVRLTNGDTTVTKKIVKK
jgi:hypothetical protein